MAASQSRPTRIQASVFFLVQLLRALHLNYVATARDRLIDDNVALDSLEILRQVTRNVVFEMAAWKLYVVQHDHASSAILATGWLLARMIARLMSALAGLFAFENIMHSFGMTSRLTSVSAIWEAVRTGFPANTFRAKLSKVVWLLDLNRSAHVPGAAEVQRGADRVLGA